ncbi:MAG: CotH kinase family protein [Ignavibacteriales bacterium]|nr:CotH kinase family protein [Ignavibacteriales bacterium]
MCNYRNLLTVLSISLMFCGIAVPQEVNFTTSNLPIFIINTNGIPIPNEPKITADMKVIYRGAGIRNSVTDTVYHYNGKIGIEIRGSSSQQFPKKQYSVETRDIAGNDIDVAMLGFPAESDWILYAPYTDKSMYRDVLVYQLAAKLGGYASRYKFCEVMLNNEYQGVYVLFEKVKRDKNRVNISKCETADTTGDALTGGYIYKVDKLDGSDNQGWYSDFLPFPNSPSRIFYQYHYPKQEDIRPAQKVYLKNKVHDFEAIMNMTNFADTTSGYPSVIDIPSFVDFFILNELSKNVDGYRLSTYFNKDRDSKGGKIKAGPVWDFNLGFGNANYYDGWKTDGFVVHYLYQILPTVSGEWFFMPAWWYKLFNEQKMFASVKSRWTTLRKTVINDAYLFSVIDSLTLELNEARARNYEKWPILGTWVWPNYFVGNTYGEELTYLKVFIHNRILWLDGAFGYNAITDDINMRPATAVLMQNFPNPFNPSTAIRFQLSAAAKVQLTIFDILGNIICSLADEYRPAGMHTINFSTEKYPGLSSGVYYYQLKTGEVTLSKKMLLLK